MIGESEEEESCLQFRSDNFRIYVCNLWTFQGLETQMHLGHGITNPRSRLAKFTKGNGESYCQMLVQKSQYSVEILVPDGDSDSFG